MKIYAPVKDATGTWCSVRFVNGVGETDNQTLIKWFRSHGYKVVEDTDKVQRVEQASTVHEDNSVEDVGDAIQPDFESMTPNDLRDWMREHGYGAKIKNTRSKEKLLAILKEG